MGADELRRLVRSGSYDDLDPEKLAVVALRLEAELGCEFFLSGVEEMDFIVEMFDIDGNFFAEGKAGMSDEEVIGDDFSELIDGIEFG